MKKVRFGVVGVGNMGSSHSTNLDNGVVPEIELTAVCDIREERRQWAKDHLSSKVGIYADPIEMFEKAPLDAVIIATPHYLHPDLVMEALKHDLPVRSVSTRPRSVKKSRLPRRATSSSA